MSVEVDEGGVGQGVRGRKGPRVDVGDGVRDGGSERGGKTGDEEEEEEGEGEEEEGVEAIRHPPNTATAAVTRASVEEKRRDLQQLLWRQF